MGTSVRPFWEAAALEIHKKYPKHLANRVALGRGLHSFPFPLNLSLLCPFPLNLSLICPSHNSN
jgi:hypothetical protein